MIDKAIFTPIFGEQLPEEDTYVYPYNGSTTEFVVFWVYKGKLTAYLVDIVEKEASEFYFAMEAADEYGSKELLDRMEKEVNAKINARRAK